MADPTPSDVEDDALTDVALIRQILEMSLGLCWADADHGAKSMIPVLSAKAAEAKSLRHENKRLREALERIIHRAEYRMGASVTDDVVSIARSALSQKDKVR